MSGDPFLFVRFIGMASHPRVKTRSYLEYSVASEFSFLSDSSGWNHGLWCKAH